MREIIIVHDFDGRPYFKALESKFNCTFVNSRPFRFILRDLIKYKKLTRDSINSLLFLLLLPLHKNKVIILGMAPFNFRLSIYGFLCLRNKVILHSSWHQWTKKTPFTYPNVLNTLSKKLWLHYLKRFNKVVAVTMATRDSIIEFTNGISTDIEVIPHVVDIELISDSLLNEKWNGKNIESIFVGRLTHEKGILDLISISDIIQKKHDNIQLKVVGKGVLDTVVIDASKKNNNLTYLGYISSREQLRSLISKAQFFLLPSKKIQGWEELFGLVIVEAMSQGCIVMSSNHIGPREIIDTGIDGILTSEEDFVEAAIQMFDHYLNEPTLYKRMSLMAREKSKNYDMVKVSQHWAEIIKGLK